MAGWRFARVPGPAGTVPLRADAGPVSLFGLRTVIELRTVMDETCAGELAAVRPRVRIAETLEVLADEAEMRLRGESEGASG